MILTRRMSSGKAARHPSPTSIRYLVAAVFWYFFFQFFPANQSQTSISSRELRCADAQNCSRKVGLWFITFPFWGIQNHPGSAAYVPDDGIATAVLQICFGVYLFVMLRKAFDASWWYCGITASVIAWSFFHIVWLYRFLLFEGTLRLV